MMIKTKHFVIMLVIFLFIILFSYYVNATSTYLTENITWQQNLTNVSQGTITFGDIDNDGDLDLALTGVEPIGAGIFHSKIYENNGTSFSENSTWQQNLTGVDYGSHMLGDIDNDGDLDLALTGCNKGVDAVSQCTSGYDLTKIYENNGTAFRENTTWSQNLTVAYRSSLSLGDIDNDGDLDLGLTGEKTADSNRIAKVYLNNGTSFVESKQWYGNLTGVTHSFIVFGDVNNDSDLDLILSGEDSGYNTITKVYLNNKTSFVESKQWYGNIHAVDKGSLVLGDFDNDNDLDLSLVGCCDHHRIYQNNGTSFVEIQKEDPLAQDSLVGIFEGSQGLGDYDNDGDLDIITTGRERYTTVYLGYGNSSFNLSNQDLESNILNLQWSSVVWGDVDNDSDLDLLLDGYEITIAHSKIYTNNITTSNTQATPPISFTNYTTVGGEIHLSWMNGSDAETPSAGLYYNLRVGSSSGGNEIVSGKYGGGEDNGYFGNMMQRKNITLKSSRLSTNTDYYWSVQVIDTGLMTSAWSAEQNFNTTGDLKTPTITLNAPIDYYNTTIPNMTFNATIYDNINVTNVSLFGNWSGGWHLNITNSSGLNNTDYIFTRNLTSDGNYIFGFKSCDNSSLCKVSENRTFMIDTTYPEISLISPANDSTWTSSDTVSFNYNVSDLSVSNCSLIIDGVLQETIYSVCIDSTETFSKSLSNGNYNWLINCTDEVNYENSSVINKLSVSYSPYISGGISEGGRSVSELVEEEDLEEEISDEERVIEEDIGEIKEEEFEGAGEVEEEVKKEIPGEEVGLKTMIFVFVICVLIILIYFWVMIEDLKRLMIKK